MDRQQLNSGSTWRSAEGTTSSKPVLRRDLLPVETLSRTWLRQCRRCAHQAIPSRRCSVLLSACAGTAKRLISVCPLKHRQCATAMLADQSSPRARREARPTTTPHRCPSWGDSPPCGSGGSDDRCCDNNRCQRGSHRLVHGLVTNDVVDHRDIDRLGLSLDGPELTRKSAPHAHDRRHPCRGPGQVESASTAAG